MLLVVCGIVFAVTFIERLPGNETVGLALMDSWVRLMEYIPQFLPLAIFMGTLLAAYNLTKSTENIIIASAGRSPFQIAAPFLFTAALIGVFATTVLNPYSVKLAGNNITDENLALVDNTVWLREASDDGFVTMSAKKMRKDNDNLIFGDATIFFQTPDFKVSERIETVEITLSDTGLYTKKANVFDKKGDMKTQTWAKKTRLNPRTVLDRYLKPSQVSFWDLPGFITKMQNIGANPREHLVQFWTLLFLPLTLLSMAALGVAFSQTHERRNYSFGTKFGIGIIACFGLYFVMSLMGALGSTGTLPAILSVLAPPMIIIAASGAFVASFDRM